MAVEAAVNAPLSGPEGRRILAGYTRIAYFPARYCSAQATGMLDQEPISPGRGGTIAPRAVR